MRTHPLIGRLLAIVALVVAVLGATATTAAAAPDHGRPFHLSFQADGSAPDELGCATTSGTGHATHMGQIAVTADTCGDSGVATWTAANGDTITVSFHSEVVGFNDDGAVIVLMVADETVGTGRFVDVALDGPGLNALVYYNEDWSFHMVAWLDTTIYYDASNRSSG